MTDLAEKYLDGVASEEELAIIQQKLKDDPSFKEEVVQLQAIKAMLQAETAANLYQELDGMFERVVRPKLGEEETEQKQTKRRSLFNTRQVMMMAAAVSLLLVAVFVFQNLSGPSAQTLYADNYRPFKAKITRNSSDRNLYTQSMELYQQRKYKEAIPVLQKALNEPNVPADQVYVMLGNSHLQLEETDKAIEAFQKTGEGTEYAEDAKWYLALTYLKVGQQEKAIALLQELANSGVLYKKKAEKLLQEF